MTAAIDDAAGRVNLAYAIIRLANMPRRGSGPGESPMNRGWSTHWKETVDCSSDGVLMIERHPCH
ncbi:MAG: hypothetical protein U0872_16935 [Planctomycetaceae bacterium]